MYLAITTVQEYDTTHGISYSRCHEIIEELYARCRKYGDEQTIYLSKNQQHYIRVSYEDRKYYSYVSSKKGDYLLHPRTAFQLANIFYTLIPDKTKYTF